MRFKRYIVSAVLFFGVGFINAQNIELVELIKGEKFKVQSIFSNEAYFVNVSHMRISEIAMGKIDTSTSNEYAFFDLLSSKSEVTGSSYGGATGSATLFGATVNTVLNKEQDILVLNVNQCKELAKAINQLFVSYEKQKMKGRTDFLIRIKTSTRLNLSNDGNKIGLEYDGETYLIPALELREMYDLVSKVK